MEIINLHLYPSTFKFESRILKETNSIIKLNLASRIIILSAGEKGQLKDEPVTERIKVHRIIPFLNIFSDSKISKALFYVEFYIRALFFGVRQKINVINCHSLMMLPLAVFLKRIKYAKLIYDPHELETERLGLHGLGQKVSKWVERNLILACDATIVVSESILKWYSSSYQLQNIFLIRNTPHYFKTSKGNILRKKLGIPDEPLIFLYQGLINEGRSIELYLSAFSKMNDHHLVIMGYGPLEPTVKHYAAKFSNIHFQPAVKPSEVLEYTQSADIGLSLIENCCLSYYYSLPNKFFEYIMAEVPLVVSNFPDMANLVKSLDIGWAVEVTEEGLFIAIKSITRDHLIVKKEKLKNVKNQFTWEIEEMTLIKIFDGL